MKGKFGRNFNLQTFVLLCFLIAIVYILFYYETGYKTVSAMSTLTSQCTETFKSSFPSVVHNAANVGHEVAASEGTKGVLGVFEKNELKGSALKSKLINDPVSNLEGSKECVNSSFGLHNSSGGLCLTDNVKVQLQTRGGNQ